MGHSIYDSEIIFNNILRLGLEKIFRRYVTLLKIVLVILDMIENLFALMEDLPIEIKKNYAIIGKDNGLGGCGNRDGKSSRNIFSPLS